MAVADGSTGPVRENGTEQAPEATWRPIARPRAHETVIERIEEQIFTGALKVGDHLPPERELASMLGVSRAAVREAIRVLEVQGVLRAGVGVGRNSGTVVSSSSSEALTRMLRLHVALTSFAITDVIEARVALERYSARLAATQGTEEDRARMGELLEQMRAPDVSLETFNDLDTQFHHLLAEAARNRLVADMTIAIRESMRTPILRSFHETVSWPRLEAELMAGHEAIYRAIVDGDARRASDAVEEHIRYAYAELQYRKDS